MIHEAKGASMPLNVGYVNTTLTAEQEANAFTTTAQLFVREGLSLDSFQENAVCLNRVEVPLTTRPNYQSMDGYGNNLKHPFWGASETPFGRFGPKNYADNAGTIKRTERFSRHLPEPRQVVDDVLIKAKKAKRTKNVLNSMWLHFLIAISHDCGHTASVTASTNPAQRVSCCTPGNQAILPRSVRHPACAPIAIAKDDSFYNVSGIRCQTFVRSQQVSSPSGVSYGEIKNKGTSFADLSVIYGSNLEESNKVRSFAQGKIRLTPGQTMPVDANGKFTSISARFIVVISVNSFITILTRNHNKFAERLADLNPSWDDERLFQEARRIMIAVFQNIAISNAVTEPFFGKFDVEGYNEDIDPSESLEFQNAAIRFNRVFVPSHLRLLGSAGNVTEIPQSNLIGRVDILEKYTEDYFRGALNQSVFEEFYSDEVRKVCMNSIKGNLMCGFTFSSATNCSKFHKDSVLLTFFLSTFRDVFE
jgi:hypothetical protein